MDHTYSWADIKIVEEAILGLRPEEPWMDLNGDGIVDMGEVVRIERVIMGFNKPTAWRWP